MLSTFSRDPFGVFFEDPFFSDVRPFGGRWSSPSLGWSDIGRSRPSTEVATTGGPGQMMNTGIWNFNQLLAEPLALNVEENDKEYKMTIHPPSDVSPDKIHIDVKNGVLTISGEHTESTVQGGTRRRSSHRFRRSTLLPADINEEQIKAQFQADKGNLVVEIPKSEKHVTKRVQIQGVSQSIAQEQKQK